MGALAGFSYREIVKRLEQLGLEFHRQAAGSHEIWFNPALNRYTTIPNHPGDMPEGTLRAIPEQAGIDAEATDSSPPTGGVIMPGVRFTIATIAKCSGSMPSNAAIGARIITPGSGSRKMPKTSSSRFTAARNVSGCRFQPTSVSASVCGMRSIVSTHANAADAPTISSAAAVSSAARARMAGSALQRSDPVSQSFLEPSVLFGSPQSVPHPGRAHFSR